HILFQKACAVAFVKRGENRRGHDDQVRLIGVRTQIGRQAIYTAAEHLDEIDVECLLVSSRTTLTLEPCYIPDMVGCTHASPHLTIRKALKAVAQYTLGYQIEVDLTQHGPSIDDLPY